jgi:hypothetical protein
MLYHTETICYDDGCHLKRYATNPTRSALTSTSSRLTSLNFVIDRMHFKGHIDPWCHENCNPQKLEDLDMVIKRVALTYLSINRYCAIEL